MNDADFGSPPPRGSRYGAPACCDRRLATASPSSGSRPWALPPVPCLLTTPGRPLPYDGGPVYDGEMDRGRLAAR